MIKYIGSKRRLVPLIVEEVAKLKGVHHVLDLFSGTSRVGIALKEKGYHVTANDHLYFPHVLATTYIAADAAEWKRKAAKLIDELNHVEPQAGWFTKTYARDSRYFTVANAARIEAIRKRIEKMALREPLRSICLTSLLEAADRVDSTVGVQMAYLRDYAPRALNDLELRVPELLPGEGDAIREEAWVAARRVKTDLAYLDPPYNNHKYKNNYHIWETLVLGDTPSVYGVARKRVDCQNYRSDFNTRRRCHEALSEVIDSLDTRYIMVSLSNEAYVKLPELLDMIKAKKTTVIEIPMARYVGSKIGIHNPDGEKVGEPGAETNVEYLVIARR